MSESQMVKRNILIVSPFGIRSSFVIDEIRKREESILEDLYRSGENTGTADITQFEELRTRVIPSRMTVENDLFMRVAYINTIAPILKQSFTKADPTIRQADDVVMTSKVVAPKIIYVDNRYPIHNWDEVIREAVKADPNIFIMHLDPAYAGSEISFKGILANPVRVKAAMKVKKVRESKARINYEEMKPELVERDVSAEMVRIDKAINSAIQDGLFGTVKPKSRYSLIAVPDMWEWWINVATALIAVMTGKSKSAGTVYRPRTYKKRKASVNGRKSSSGPRKKEVRK